MKGRQRWSAEFSDCHRLLSGGADLIVGDDHGRTVVVGAFDEVKASPSAGLVDVNVVDDLSDVVAAELNESNPSDDDSQGRTSTVDLNVANRDVVAAPDGTVNRARLICGRDPDGGASGSGWVSLGGQSLIRSICQRMLEFCGKCAGRTWFAAEKKMGPVREMTAFWQRKTVVPAPP